MSFLGNLILTLWLLLVKLSLEFLDFLLGSKSLHGIWSTGLFLNDFLGFSFKSLSLGKVGLLDLLVLLLFGGWLWLDNDSLDFGCWHCWCNISSVS